MPHLSPHAIDVEPREDPRPRLETVRGGDRPSRWAVGLEEITQSSIDATEDVGDAEWDDFVAHHAEPHHEQLSAWAAVKGLSGWTSVRLAITSGTRILGCAQVLEITFKGIVKVGYLCRGPLVSHDRFNARMVHELKALSRRRGQAYLAVSLPYCSQAMTEDLRSGGFVPRPHDLPPAVWTRATLLLDLTKSVDELFMDLRRSTRREIKKGVQAGVTVREGENADLSLFCRLVLELCRRRGVSSNMPEERALGAFWKALHPRSRMRLFVAEMNGTPLCVLAVISLGKWARAWRIGWRGDFKDAHPTKVLYWHVIRLYKELGCEVFDWIGVDERDARELLAGRPSESPFHCSMTKFKLGFGGQITLLPGEWCYVSNPILRRAFGVLGPSMMRSSWIRSMARWAHSTAARPTE